MLPLTYRLIAALLFVLVANPVCCCDVESAPKCCLPADAEGQSETPKKPNDGGCECCQCGEEMNKPTEGGKLAPSAKVDCSPLGACDGRESYALPTPTPRNRRETLASRCGWHRTLVPIYQRHCSFLL